MKTILRTVILVIILAGGFYLARHFGLFPNFSLFRKEVKIDKTANVIEEIKKIGEFTCVCYYEEMVITKSKRSDFNDSRIGRLSNKVSNEEVMDEIVLIAYGKVSAGYDLSKIDVNKIHVNGDTLNMELPQAEIFDIIINPSGYEIYVEKGSWKHEQVTELQTEAKHNLEKNALDYDLVKKAETTGVAKLQNLFLSLGFSQVYLTIQPSTN